MMEYEQLREENSKLQQEIMKLKSIISKTPGHLYWKDKEGVYLGCNEGMLNIHHLDSEQDFTGRTTFDFLEESQAALLHRQDEKIMKSGQEEIIEEKGFDVNGNEAFYITRKVPLKNKRGHVLGLLGVSFDITDRIRAEELEKKNQIAQKVIQKLKTIAGSLSHEIRTPLAGVRTGLSLLRSFFSKAKQDLTQITTDILEQQEQWTSRLIERIDNGNTLISIQLKNMATERINIDDFIEGDLSQWVKQSVKTFPFENESLRQKVHLEACSEARIMGDPLLTQHVIWNLLNNAFHFIKETGRGEIFIVIERIADNYVLRFKDTAKGMNSKEATQVFEQFYTNRSGGCGLGLHFCQLVMEAYQGRIECRAQEGLYTEFLLSFPKEAVFGLELLRLETKELQA